MGNRSFALTVTIATLCACILLAFAVAMPSIAQADEWGQPTIRLKMTADVKNTKSLTTYPGKVSKLKVAVTGADASEVKWSSTNKKIATVSKKGKVTAKAKGRCYVKATVRGKTRKVLVEVTSPEAYQAVQNAFADKKTKISYSQAKRMKTYYRDCSSFVSRCYWDEKLGRAIFAIGGEEGKSWAYPAADQAIWLNSVGKRVAWRACSVKKLRPGDTLYFETDYAGRDATQWRYIDHADMYVGNGYVMDTGGSGGLGIIGFRWCKYYSTDTSIKFIGRPCP